MPDVPSSSLLRESRQSLLVAAVAAVCYLNVLPNDYCYDDVPIVAENPVVQHAGRWSDVWASDYWRATEAEWPSRDLLYRPVSVSSYRLVRQTAGASPLPQRALNMLLHCMVCVLLVDLCRRMSFGPRAALAAGLIFAVLPIHSEAVAAIVGRADILVALFILLALLMYARAQAATAATSRALLYLAASVSVFLAVASKENGIAVFPLIVLWDVLLNANAYGRRRWFDGRAVLRLEFCLLPPLLMYLALRYHALGGRLISQPDLTKTVNVLVDAPAWQRSLGVVQAWGMYWAKTFWPKTLCINYSINAVRLATGLLDAHVILGIVGAAMLMGLAAWAAVRRRWSLVFVVAALVICYLPTSNAFTLIQVFFAERIWYVPSLFAAVLLGWAAAPLLRLRWARVAACLVLVLAGARICWRSFDWRNNGTLFASAYEAHPDGVQPLYLHGQWLAGHGRLPEGTRLLEQAVLIDPGYTDAQRALGRAYLEAGRAGDAVRALQVAEMQVPGNKSTREALDRARAAVSQQTKASLADLTSRAASSPDDLDAHLSLVRALRESGQPERALAHLKELDATLGDSPAWQAEFAVTLVFLNRVDEAIERYHRSLALQEHPQIAAELAMLLLERRAPGDIDEADRLSVRAVDLNSQSPTVLVSRAEVLALKGELEAAAKFYRQAIVLLPPGDAGRQQFIERARALGLRIED